MGVNGGEGRRREWRKVKVTCFVCSYLWSWRVGRGVEEWESVEECGRVWREEGRGRKRGMNLFSCLCINSSNFRGKFRKKGCTCMDNGFVLQLSGMSLFLVESLLKTVIPS